MSQATQSPPTTGEFCWYEINTPDLEAAKKFYGDVFGWTFEEIPMDGFNYTMLHKDGMAFGGMMHMTGPQWEGVPPHWMSYIAVGSVADTVAAARTAGARIEVQKVPKTDSRHVFHGQEDPAVIDPDVECLQLKRALERSPR